MMWIRTSEDHRRHARQKDVVLDHLKTGQPLNQTEALERYNIRRLASRISELRRAGWLILSLRGKDSCAVYLLLGRQGGDRA
jgi:hypothetical protein